MFGEAASVRLDTTPLRPHITYEFHAGQTLDVIGNLLFLLEGEGPAEELEAGTPESGLPNLGLATIDATGQPGSLVPLFPARPPDEFDDMIISELGEREAAITVEQTATFQISMANGGGIVAAFDIQIEGIDPSWVSIMPPHVNLNEGGRANATIAIRPPRASSSMAGPHHFLIVVTSLNYPGRRSSRGATVNIAPYHEFYVSDISPRQQSVGWFRKTAEVSFEITNRSNCDTLFQVEGIDDEKALDFEFYLAPEKTTLATRAQVKLKPDETLPIPVHITPRARTLIALTQHQHSFNITSSMADTPQSGRMLLGFVRRQALIGPFLLFLIVLLLAAGIIYTFWPRVSIKVTPQQIIAGQQAKIEWSASPPFLIEVKLNGEPAVAPSSSVIKRPITNTTYQVQADTWLSKIFPTIAGKASETVTVEPVSPQISLFEADPDHITAANQTVTLSWLAVDADEVILVDVLAGKEEKLDKPYGAKTVKLEKGSMYILKAKNNSVPDQPIQKQLDIPLIIPVPVIDSFLVTPETITAGQTVTITWKVRQAEKIAVEPAGKDLPLAGELVYAPKETTALVLTATNGTEVAMALKQVKVNPAPPEAVPPVIDAFIATPEKGVGGTTVKLDWSISGAVGKIELTDGNSTWNNVKVSENYDEAIKAKGTLSVTVDATTLYTLTAYNGDKQAVKTLKIAITDPAAPVISAFTVAPEEPTSYPVSSVVLNWLITGDCTKFEITYDNVILSSDSTSIYYDATLKLQGSKTIANITKPTMFVLTTYNGAAKAILTAAMK